MAKTEGVRIIKIPIYAYWRCQKCDSINLSSGYLTIHMNEKKGIVSNDEYESCMANALEIILDPKKHLAIIRSVLKNQHCEKCKMKSLWAKLLEDQYYPLALLGICISSLIIAVFPAVILEGILASNHIYESVATYIVWAISTLIVMTLFLITINRKETKRSRDLPEKNVPVLFTDDYNVCSYAQAHGKQIPTQQEALSIIHARSVHGTIEND